MSLPDTIIIAHGKSERFLIRAIANRLKVPVEMYCKEGGEETISMKDIGKVLTQWPFDTESNAHREFRSIEYRPRNGGLRNVTIIPVLDVDGDARSYRSYMSGDIFRDSIFRDRIIPVANEPNLEAVMEDIGYPPIKDKIDWYTSVDVEPMDFYKRLARSQKTNMEQLMKHLMNRCPAYQNKT